MGNICNNIKSTDELERSRRSLAICFLEHLKLDILDQLENGSTDLFGGCGNNAAACYIDDIIARLTKMETDISNLRYGIKYRDTELAKYKETFGCLEEWTEDELKEIKKKIINFRNEKEGENDKRT